MASVDWSITTVLSSVAVDNEVVVQLQGPSAILEIVCDASTVVLLPGR